MKAKANFTYYFIFCIFFVSYDYAMIIPTTQGNLQKITPSGHGPQSIKSFFDDKKNTISIIIFPSKTIND
ncbi:MAG TPA: hypothetical protein VL201_00775, partial [Patescibacteria group bacterium]|nr:hypothetical protein [Patescibacteria group bacterium]